MSEKQEQEELAVFLQFATVCPRHIDTRSIQARPSPEPDILCNVDGALCAFELVELVDQAQRRRVRRQIEMQSTLLDACDALPESVRVELIRRAGNTSIFVDVVDAASKPARQKAVSRIVESLCAIEPDFAGPLVSEPWWSGIIDKIVVTRLKLIGPVFSVKSAGYISEHVLSPIHAKLAKAYQSEAPIELLAYFRHSTPPPSFWAYPLEELLRNKSANAKFRRIWVFDHTNRRIEFVWPA
jgi:hypothetical protein